MKDYKVMLRLDYIIMTSKVCVVISINIYISLLKFGGHGLPRFKTTVGGGWVSLKSQAPRKSD